ncbi:DNA-binding NarL/FixJ family response regulator [Nonomuraea thailandensis]|uniref:DNA-binding NarL/FixJ family response regulator n=1 Tax=Nonomuraea thailandensis TaxID=1188745 RepID=A0A9X2GE57_9ACTN|nr:response regulator transcription factor [Nonomuraea thailandensis]MCP2357434.1 DNA-binding NarL/FixJ family response regulator [Nonomuraea thailandensis]
MSGIRVMLVDDQALLRTSLRTVLSADERIEVTHDVADGGEAIEVVRRHRLDVVLMDVRMPRVDGVAATTEIVRIAPATRVLMLTTFDDDELVVAAVRAGASGYLTKDVRPAALAQAVCDVASGTAALAPGVAATILDLVRRVPARRAAALDGLTPREAEVYGLLARGRSNGEIRAELVLSENTVKTHVRAVLQKLGLRDRVHAVIHAYENGLVGRNDLPG